MNNPQMKTEQFLREATVIDLYIAAMLQGAISNGTLSLTSDSEIEKDIANEALELIFCYAKEMVEKRNFKLHHMNSKSK
jgi:hypothetical protein